jgi:hypothetical protein
VPGADVGCAAVDPVDRVLDLGEPGFGAGGAVEVVLVPQGRGGGFVVSLFFAEPFLLALVLAAGDLLFLAVRRARSSRARSFSSVVLAR